MLSWIKIREIKHFILRGSLRSATHRVNRRVQSSELLEWGILLFSILLRRVHYRTRYTQRACDSKPRSIENSWRFPELPHFFSPVFRTGWYSDLGDILVTEIRLVATEASGNWLLSQKFRRFWRFPSRCKCDTISCRRHFILDLEWTGWHFALLNLPVNLSHHHI